MLIKGNDGQTYYGSMKNDLMYAFINDWEKMFSQGEYTTEFYSQYTDKRDNSSNYSMIFPMYLKVVYVTVLNSLNENGSSLNSTDIIDVEDGDGKVYRIQRVRAVNAFNETKVGDIIFGLCAYLKKFDTLSMPKGYYIDNNYDGPLDKVSDIKNEYKKYSEDEINNIGDIFRVKGDERLRFRRIFYNNETNEEPENASNKELPIEDRTISKEDFERLLINGELLSEFGEKVKRLKDPNSKANPNIKIAESRYKYASKFYVGIFENDKLTKILKSGIPYQPIDERIKYHVKFVYDKVDEEIKRKYPNCKKYIYMIAKQFTNGEQIPSDKKLISIKKYKEINIKSLEVYHYSEYIITKEGIFDILATSDGDNK